MKSTLPTPRQPDEPLDALDELNSCIMRAYRAFIELQHKSPAHHADEHQRRQVALRYIREDVLQSHPLESFKAGHLVFLGTLISFWRTLEEVAGAPEPDKLQ